MVDYKNGGHLFERERNPYEIILLKSINLVIIVRFSVEYEDTFSDVMYS